MMSKLESKRLTSRIDIMVVKTGIKKVDVPDRRHEDLNVASLDESCKFILIV
jgi:hypothetical protein